VIERDISFLCVISEQLFYIDPYATIVTGSRQVPYLLYLAQNTHTQMPVD